MMLFHYFVGGLRGSLKQLLEERELIHATMLAALQSSAAAVPLGYGTGARKHRTVVLARVGERAERMALNKQRYCWCNELLGPIQSQERRRDALQTSMCHVGVRVLPDRSPLGQSARARTEHGVKFGDIFKVI